MKIVCLGGSLNPDSTSLMALKIARKSAEEAGAVTRLYDVRDMQVPFYVPGSKEAPEIIKSLADDICEAGGMIWSSPLYHGTISGVFKNVLDWLNIMATNDPPYLTNKIIGLISTAGGVQGLQAINTMDFIVRALRGWTVPMVMPVAKAWQVFNKEGNITDKAVEEQLKLLGKEVVKAAEQMQSTGSCDYSEK